MRLNPEQHAMIQRMTPEERLVGADLGDGEHLLGANGVLRLVAARSDQAPEGFVSISLEERVPIEQPGYPWSPWTEARTWYAYASTVPGFDAPPKVKREQQAAQQLR